MSIGTVSQVLICQADTSSPASVLPCIDDSSGAHFVPVTHSALLIDPSMDSFFTELNQPFDGLFAGSVFGFFFASVIFCWFLGKAVGTVWKTIKSS